MKGTSQQNTRGDPFGHRHRLFHSLRMFPCPNPAETSQKSPISFFPHAAAGREQEKARVSQRLWKKCVSWKGWRSLGGWEAMVTRPGQGLGGVAFDLTTGSNFTLSIQARYMIHSAFRLSIISRTIRTLNKLRFISSVSEERWISLLFVDVSGIEACCPSTGYWLARCCGKTPLPSIAPRAEVMLTNLFVEPMVLQLYKLLTTV